MIDIKQVHEQTEKSFICEKILRDLPDWFGVEASIIDYTKNVTTMPFFAVYSDDNPGGFAALKIHNSHTAEIYVMGILEKYHRQGIGSKLIKFCENFCVQNRIEFLTVKTLDKSCESDSYRKTRQFYEAMKFRPLEVFPYFWDEQNPCLFMAKYIQLDK